MKPIAPMLAVPMAKANIIDWNDWVMEEKFDGWRLVVTIDVLGNVTAHTRERKHAGGDGKTQNDVTDMLPKHLLDHLSRFAPSGNFTVLDGELLVRKPDGTIGTSTDVPRSDLRERLYYVAFDVLMTGAGSCMMQPWVNRRAILKDLFKVAAHGVQGLTGGEVTEVGSVHLADTFECCDEAEVASYCHEVWARGGEGLILKDKRARYEAGKRRASFVKLKKLFTAVLEVTGFEASRGTVLQRGPYATVVGRIVEAPEGHEALVGRETSVKTKDDDALEQFRQDEGRTRALGRTQHVAIGRRLRIEYQDIAADGGVRHPRWDRWEDE